MFYPAPRYFGEHGEISAAFRAATDAPDFGFRPVATDGPDVSEGRSWAGQVVRTVQALMPGAPYTWVKPTRGVPGT